MKFSLLSVLFLFGSFQALLFIAGLWRRKSQRPVSFWLLTGLLGSIAIILAHHGFYTSLKASAIKYRFIGFSAAAWLAVLPFLHFYVRSLLEDDFRWRKDYWLFFGLPLYHLVTWVMEFSGVYWGVYYFFGNRTDLYTYFWIGGYLVYSFVFAGYTLRYLYQQDRKHGKLPWLRRMLQFFLVAIVVSSISLIYLIANDNYSEDFEYALLVVFELFVLSLVYQSIRRSAYSGWLANRLYGAAAKPESELKVLYRTLENHMKSERPYLSPDLQLKDLAGACAVSENELSQVFTQYLDTGFYEYVNRYRLRTFEERLSEAERLTVTGLAQQCGFRSKTAFYRIFKEEYGTTPAAFIRRSK